MINVDEVLNSIKNQALTMVKGELRDFLTSAAQDTEPLIRETAEKVAAWVVLLAKGELSDREFEALLYARDQILRQAKNTLDIQGRARLEKIAVGLLNLVLDKIVGTPLA